MALSDAAVRLRFDTAVRYIKSLPKDGPLKPSHSQQLSFYGLYKQAECGPCSEVLGWLATPVARAKHSAWSALGQLSGAEAREKYVQSVLKLLNGLDPGSLEPQFRRQLEQFREDLDKHSKPLVAPNSPLARDAAVEADDAAAAAASARELAPAAAAAAAAARGDSETNAPLSSSQQQPASDSSARGPRLSSPAASAQEPALRQPAAAASRSPDAGGKSLEPADSLLALRSRIIADQAAIAELTRRIALMESRRSAAAGGAPSGGGQRPIVDISALVVHLRGLIESLAELQARETHQLAAALQRISELEAQVQRLTEVLAAARLTTESLGSSGTRNNAAASLAAAGAAKTARGKAGRKNAAAKVAVTAVAVVGGSVVCYRLWKRYRQVA